MFDKFNQKDNSNSNGSIPYIQGEKNNSEGRSSVWPKIHVCIKSLFFRNNVTSILSIHISFFYQIPNQFTTSEDTFLVIYAVREVLENGKIIWFKHADRHFLPEDFERQSSLMNPFELKLHGLTLSDEGDFT